MRAVGIGLWPLEASECTGGDVIISDCCGIKKKASRKEKPFRKTVDRFSISVPTSVKTPVPATIHERARKTHRAALDLEKCDY